MAACVGSLVAAGSASAAIAGAPPEQTTNRPDLISVADTPGASGSVEFCFDKTLANQAAAGGAFVPGDFQLGGYRSQNAAGAVNAALETNPALQPSNGPADSCVRATFSGVGDLHQYTIGTVLAGAVITNGGTSASTDGNNFDDSALYSSSTTHNGTSGFSAGPDLQSVIVDSTSNTISYIEDQNVATSGGGAPVAAGFNFVDAAGNVCTGTGISPATGGNDVVVSFTGAACGEGVNNAVRAGQADNTVTAANDPTATNFDNEVVVPGGGTGTTSKPDLTGVTIESNQQAMDFTFDKTVTPSTVTNFRADLSTGDEVAADTANVIATSTSSTTLRVTFPNFSTYDEYVVAGSVAGNGTSNGAVVESSGGASLPNTPGSQPIPPPFGNAGAFARGFTTGPDAMAAQLNTTTGVLSVVLDQRAFNTAAANPANIRLLDQTGNVTGAAGAGAVTYPTQPAGQQTITVQYSPGQAATAHNLDLAFGALFTNLRTGSDGNCIGNDCSDQPNVDQILHITTTSSKLLRERMPALSRKQLKARNARLRKAEARRLAAMRRHHHKRARHHH